MHRLADAGNWDRLMDLYERADAAARTEAAAGAATADRSRVRRSEIARLLALEAPARYAVRALAREYADRAGAPAGMRLGLWEVLATRPWAELDAHLTHRELRHLVAHSRVLRGDDLSAVAGLDPAVFAGVPFALQPWEAAHWDPRGGMMRGFSRQGEGGGLLTAFPYGDVRRPVPLPRPDGPPRDRAAAPGMLGSTWIEPFTVRATAWQAAAYAASLPPDPIAVPEGGEVEFAAAYPALLAAAAGEGAYSSVESEGLGRVAVWRALAAMGGFPEPLDPAAVAELVGRLRCVAWSHPSDEIWFVHVAVEDPAQGRSWVFDGQTFD